MSLIVGPHMSIGKGFDAAVQTAQSIGATTLQVFTRNPRGGKARQVPEAEFERVRTLSAEYGIGPIVAHAPYTVNLASAKDDVRAFGREVIAADLLRAAALGACGLVVHSGAHTGSGVAEGHARLLAELDFLLPHIPDGCRLLLESMSGSGSELGRSAEELAMLLQRLDAPDRLGVCLDTCHLFAAGVDVRHWAEAKRAITDHLPMQAIGACHLNDSKTPLGSHRDRHEVLGDGHIGWEAFRQIVCDDEMCARPLILETPNELAGWQEEIATLRRLRLEHSQHSVNDR